MNSRFCRSVSIALLVLVVATPRPLAGRAIDDLTGGGPLPNVPDVPEPTIVDGGDRYEPDPVDHTPAPTQEELRQERERQERDRLERDRLDREQQDRDRLERERKQKEQAERDRLDREEAARRYQQWLEQQRIEAARIEAARIQAEFEQKKRDLVSAFRLAPAIPLGTPHPRLGAGAPIALPPDATPDQRCRQLLAVQTEIDELEAREGKLTMAERNRLGQAILRRNMLWRLAVTAEKRLDADERERYRLPLPIVVQAAVRLENALRPSPRVAAEPQRPLADASAPVVQTMLATMNTDHLVSWIEDKAGGVIEDGLGEEALGHFENVLGVATIALKTAQSGRAAGLAEGVDFVIGKVATPGAGFAVTGGRQVADVAFKAQTKFMEDAMLATGGTFDSKEFWQKLRGEFSTSGQAVFEWVGAPGGDE